MAPFYLGREQSKMHQLPETGYLRLPQIIGDPNAEPPVPAVIPVGKSTWWSGVKSGRFPKPVKLGPRITAWRVEDVRRLIERGAS
jgi:prophage regulatory protein